MGGDIPRDQGARQRLPGPHLVERGGRQVARAAGVAVSPGATQVAAIPSPPCPTASVLASATSAPLLVT